MKTFRFTRLTASAACLLLLPMLGFSQNQANLGVPKIGGTREVITEELLQKAVRENKKLSDGIKALALPLTAARPSLESTLYSRSIILFDGKMHTVVPLGSILALPVEYQRCIIPQPSGDFTYWPSFLAKNTSWLGGHEVTLTMTKGAQKEALKVYKEIQDQKKVLIALYQSCPISILEPVPPAKAPPPLIPPITGTRNP